VDRIEAIRTLIAAVDEGSLSAASRKLNVPLPTVSRRVSDLEAYLGSQLVVRTSRKLLLTETGENYLHVVRQVLEDLTEAERVASGEYRAPRGELIVTAPIMFGEKHVAPLIYEFLRSYVDVTVRLVLFDSVIDLVESRIDVGVRIGHFPESTLIARRVGEIQWVVCASPEYLARRGIPSIPSELSAHDCVAMEGLQDYRDWFFAGPDGTQRYAITPRFSANTADAVVAAAVAGVGVARVMSYQAAAHIKSGSLIALFGNMAPPPMPVRLVRARQPYQPLKLRTFLDFIAPRLEESLLVG
jgi:DNA-binding transcriptional LysR family regulator